VKIFEDSARGLVPRIRLAGISPMDADQTRRNVATGMAENSVFQVRPFENGDMGGILEIEKGAFPKTPYPREVFRQYAAVFPETFLVVHGEKEVAGYIIFDSGGHVISMAVRKEHRRSGFGTSLFMRALEQAGSRLWLEVRTKNRGAIDFYRSLGMKVVRKIPGYYGNDDALVMVRAGQANRGRG
jgi:ribosomal-protein-alanine N-acetyltransferase